MLKDPISWLYPAIEPYNTGKLQVSDLHSIYFEESGNPKGKPAVFLHGGPGGGTDAKQRRFFDPRIYRIILFDQRGCGKSTPLTCLEENTTWDLVSDIEKLRTHLDLERWLVFGGSWGSTLALAYSQKHPERVSELVLRGIFLCRKSEISWLYQYGTSLIFPEAFAKYQAIIPPDERHDMLHAYHKRLISEDYEVRVEAAQAWAKWEASTSKLFIDPQMLEKFDDADTSLAFSRIESHYFVNDAFLKSEMQLIDDVKKIRHIPAVIVHGRYDVVCPLENAFLLHSNWPEAELMVVPDAGHAASEPGISKALVAATDKFASW